MKAANLRLRWTDSALRDLEAIGDALCVESSAYGNRIVARIFAQTDILVTHPHSGRPGRVPETRELVINDTPYLVAYRVVEDVVELLAVVHGARRWPESFT